MRELTAAVVRELDLDDGVTLVSGGASRNYEIVMWDRPHNTYFSIRLNWDPHTPDDALADGIKRQLLERLNGVRRGRRQFAERSPLSRCPQPHDAQGLAHLGSRTGHQHLNPLDLSMSRPVGLERCD